jgi:aldehyde dehydrogenase (NAD+)
MKEEIFELLPILEYSSDADIYTIVSDMKTIVFIRFTENKIFAEKIIQTILLRRCVNDTIIHFLNKRLPFMVSVTVVLVPYHGAEF